MSGAQHQREHMKRFPGRNALRKRLQRVMDGPDQVAIKAGQATSQLQTLQCEAAALTPPCGRAVSGEKQLVAEAGRDGTLASLFPSSP
eukprot:COSAG01_NODE_47205_length_392_cov_3.122867_1_plen_87_part_10